MEESAVNTLIDSIADSTVITDLIVTKIDAEQENVIKNLNISENLDTTTKELIETAIAQKVESNELNSETKSLLEKILLGINPVQ